MSLQECVGYIADWRKRTFPEQGAEGVEAKLFAEIWEFVENGDGGELVDMFITLINYADLAFTIPQFERMVAEKMAINEARTWNTNPDGSGQHEEEE